MNDDLKEKIIIQMIKSYKNRDEWPDEYVKDKYETAIEYLMMNFDNYISASQNSVNGQIKRKKQESREIEYFGSDNTTSSWKNDSILVSLLGLPLMRCF